MDYLKLAGFSRVSVVSRETVAEEAAKEAASRELREAAEHEAQLREAAIRRGDEDASRRAFESEYTAQLAKSKETPRDQALRRLRTTYRETPDSAEYNKVLRDVIYEMSNEHKQGSNDLLASTLNAMLDAAGVPKRDSDDYNPILRFVLMKKQQK